MQNGQTLYLGKARNDLGRAHGTTVTVRDLFNSIPVRRASLASAPSTSLVACRQALEVLALVSPRTRWTLWEERLGGMKKVLYWGGVRQARALTQLQLTSRARTASRRSAACTATRRLSAYRASVSRRVSGAWMGSSASRVHSARRISTSVSSSEAMAALTPDINGYAVPNSELHRSIGRRFASSQFSVMVSWGDR